MQDALRAVAPGVWISTEPVSVVGTALSVNMTVLRLAGDALLLYSPVPLTPERKAAVDALGRVAHLYAPNTFHHLWLGDWSAAYPEARVHAPAALAGKRPDLRLDRAHDLGRDPAFAGFVDEHHIDGFRMEETVLYYRPARALVVADLVQNLGRPPGVWTRIYLTLAGFWDQVALSRVLRWTAFSDRYATRRSLDAVLAHELDVLVVGHGEPVTENPREALAAAYAWLPAGEVRALVPSACG
ncbi:MAG: hypothetical protein H6737_16540 [Alphaproteobacteria bacterium]|nr:hypothetical protein [Alphaproteobacteria bacterium]